MAITLDSHVCWLAILLERVNKVNRVVRVPISHLQKAKHSLELNQQVVLYLASFPLTHHDIFSVDCLQHKVPELRNHKALLEHADHVANVAKIDDTRVHVT